MKHFSRQLFSDTCLLSAFWCLVLAGAFGVMEAMRIISLHILGWFGW